MTKKSVGKTSRKEYEITLEEAIKLLPDGDMIHTFRSIPIALIGADWKRNTLIKAMKKHGIEKSGEKAQKMKHGLILIDDNGPLFIETKEKE